MVNMKEIPKKPRICFIAANAYPLLTGKATERIIGPDVYTAILARKMSTNGYSVSLITYWNDGSQKELIDNIMVYKMSDRLCPFGPMDKLVKLMLIWKNMVKVNADYYFHAGGMDGAGVLLCKIMRKRYVYSVSSDTQLDRQLITIDNNDFSKSKLNIGTLGCIVDILLADTIIVQSEHQKRLLKEKFNKIGTVIKMPFPITKKQDFEKTSQPTVMWVGSLAKVKQPELFVQIAESVPEANFLMIGGGSKGHDVISNYIAEKEVTLSNFHYLGVVPFDQIGTYFEKATILANTSLFEGFPNAFIQSWMHCTPVVSLNADPDDIICNLKLGFHSGSIEQMVKDIRELLQNQDLCKKMGQNGRRYIESNHDIDAIAHDYEDIFT